MVSLYWNCLQNMPTVHSLKRNSFILFFPIHKCLINTRHLSRNFFGSRFLVGILSIRPFQSHCVILSDYDNVSIIFLSLIISETNKNLYESIHEQYLFHIQFSDLRHPKLFPWSSLHFILVSMHIPVLLPKGASFLIVPLSALSSLSTLNTTSKQFFALLTKC
jgi:hypothetical protein